MNGLRAFMRRHKSLVDMLGFALLLGLAWGLIESDLMVLRVYAIIGTAAIGWAVGQWLEDSE